MHVIIIFCFVKYMNEPSLNELSFIDHFSGKSETQREEKSYLRTVLAK